MSQRGFTLIETVIVIALVVIMSFVLTELYLGHNRIYQTQNAELNVNYSARMALDEIDEAVRQANVVEDAYGGYTTGAQTMVLAVQAYNASEHLVPGVYDHIIFYVDGSRLIRQIVPDPASSRPAQTKQIAENLSGLVFSYDQPVLADTTAVRTDLTIQAQAGHEVRAITVSSQARLRN